MCVATIRSSAGGFTWVGLRLSLAPRACIALARNSSCPEEPILNFSHAARLDLPPGTEALQVWWVRLFETVSFANQIAGRPWYPHRHRIRASPVRPRARHGSKWCKTRTEPHLNLNCRIFDEAGDCRADLEVDPCVGEAYRDALIFQIL